MASPSGVVARRRSVPVCRGHRADARVGAGSLAVGRVEPGDRGCRHPCRSARRTSSSRSACSSSRGCSAPESAPGRSPTRLHRSLRRCPAALGSVLRGRGRPARRPGGGDVRRDRDHRCRDGVLHRRGVRCRPSRLVDARLAHRTRWRVGVVRALLETGVTVLGFALGGTVGIGTLAFAFGIGPAVELAFWVLARTPVTDGEVASVAR